MREEILFLLDAKVKSRTHANEDRIHVQGTDSIDFLRHSGYNRMLAERCLITYYSNRSLLKVFAS